MTRYLTRRNEGHRHSIYLPEIGPVVDENPDAGDGGDIGEHPGLASHVSLGLSATHTHTHNHDGTYAPTHSHPYAPTHSHPYASDSHSHQEVAHDHDADYAGTGHSHDTTHDHDAEYSASGHAHTAAEVGASATGHTHDTTHDHDSEYAPVHSHPYADTSHNHDAAYSAAAHTHTLNDGDIPAGIARDTEVSAAITAHLSAATHGSEGGGFEFPVGSIYIETTGVNPGTTFGYGTWTAFGVGRFLLGTDSAAGTEAGSATHSHNFTQPDAHTGVINHTHAVTVTDPGHVHDEYNNTATTGPNTGWGAQDTSTNNASLTGYDTGSSTTGITASTANPAGGVASLTHANGAVADGDTAPPSITAFMWQRTA